MDPYHFATPEELAIGLADRVAAELMVAINERGHAVLAVSGGETPRLFFEHLSKANILWNSITITLVDERYIPLDHPRSNEGMIRRHLLQNFAGKARFVGLYMAAKTAELAAFSASCRINALPKPFDVTILGMGTDGHTASFFSKSDRLKMATDCNARAMVLPIHSKGLSEVRLTMTLPLLIHSRFLALHIEGREKLACFEKALEKGPAEDLPIRFVLLHAVSPMHLFWSPNMQEINDQNGHSSSLSSPE